jgi:hypothetical protein
MTFSKKAFGKMVSNKSSSTCDKNSHKDIPFDSKNLFEERGFLMTKLEGNPLWGVKFCGYFSRYYS